MERRPTHARSAAATTALAVRIRLALCLSTTLALTAAAEVTLVDDGRCEAVIHASARVVEGPGRPDKERDGINPGVGTDLERLHDSVVDLAHYLEKISGATVPIVTGPPKPGEERITILIGELGAEKFGPPARHTTYKQGFRLVVSPAAVGMIGESDLATSYAIYELLDRLGCRWFMPSEMGEVIPRMATIALPELDFSSAPATIERWIWQADADYKRRNRLGGLHLRANHALGSYLKKEDLEAHPDWRAVVDGKPESVFNRVKWTRPEVAEAIAAKIIAHIDRTGAPSMSLSPEDGIRFDESEDPAFDAGDFDPVHNTVSITDRLMILANRVAERVTAKYPDTLFGMITYVQFTRAPVREKVHPNIVPVICHLTYPRNHLITDDSVPNYRSLREAIDGWGKAARMTGTYWLGWNTADMAAPYPQIAKWSVDLPYLFERGCKFFTPETTSNFETTMHGLYLGMRLAWDTTLDPEQIVDEINTRFYGNAAAPMAAYWEFVDGRWINVPDYAGATFGFLRRFPPETVKEMRTLLNAGLRAAKTPQEKFRVQMANDSLILFEKYMKMRYDLAEGRFARLGHDAYQWIGRMHAMAERYRAQYAFAARWYGAGGVWGSNNNVDNFVTFYKDAYDDAARIAKYHTVVTPEPLREWRYEVDAEYKGESLGWAKPGFDDEAWKTTDVAVDTWSALGHHNYFGRMWYRAKVKLPPAEKGRRTYLWLGLTDGHVKLFVDGRHVPYVNLEGEQADSFVGFCRPVSLDISDVVHADGEHQLAIACDRRDLNEIGVGGLLGPAVIYCDGIRKR